LVVAVLLAAGLLASAGAGGVSADPPADITIQSGDNQSAQVETHFAQPFTVLVVDGSGHPVSGVIVTFAAAQSGPSGTWPGIATSEVIPTAASGAATATPFAANGTAGSYEVTATVGSLPAEAFEVGDEPAPPGLMHPEGAVFAELNGFGDRAVARHVATSGARAR